MHEEQEKHYTLSTIHAKFSLKWVLHLPFIDPRLEELQYTVAPANPGLGKEDTAGLMSSLSTLNSSPHPSEPATLTHSGIITPDKRASHQHRPDKHYSQMTAYRSVLATV